MKIPHINRSLGLIAIVIRKIFSHHDCWQCGLHHYFHLPRHMSQVLRQHHSSIGKAISYLHFKIFYLVVVRIPNMRSNFLVKCTILFGIADCWYPTAQQISITISCFVDETLYQLNNFTWPLVTTIHSTAYFI